MSEYTVLDNRGFEIPFMKAEGAYHILAEVLGLEHKKEGIFVEKGTRKKFVINRYGFREVNQYNEETKREQLEKRLKKQGETISHLNNRISKQNTKISNLYCQLEKKIEKIETLL